MHGLGVRGHDRSVMSVQIIRKERSVGVKPSVPTIYEVRLLMWSVASLSCRGGDMGVTAWPDGHCQAKH